MNRYKFNALQENFLQRRYGVSLGRRYVLAAASIMMLNVLGYSSAESNTNAISQSRLSSSDSSLTIDKDKW
ncbi:proteinase inhibitor I4 serpin [Okeanomitos corallinicola TIOX110]|uniref:Proteinase inhibitor I4 serpin n=1 Tax=Okeanomitos corallinicola TIOX110 TaxID=3133117 RepID=A0ABZ2UXN4_9CYAN